MIQLQKTQSEKEKLKKGIADGTLNTAQDEEKDVLVAKIQEQEKLLKMSQEEIQ